MQVQNNRQLEVAATLSRIYRARNKANFKPCQCTYSGLLIENWADAWVIVLVPRAYAGPLKGEFGDYIHRNFSRVYNNEPGFIAEPLQ